MIELRVQNPSAYRCPHEVDHSALLAYLRDYQSVSTVYEAYMSKKNYITKHISFQPSYSDTFIL